MNKYQERLRSEIDRIGVQELSKKMGIARNTLYNWAEKSNTPLDKLMELAEHGLDIEYIITGSTKENAQNIEQNFFDDEFSLVPFYDVEISAGFGRDNSDVHEPTSHLAYRRDWLKRQRLHIDSLISTRISGDSMEPTIPDNSTILIDKTRHQPRDGHIYVLRNGDTYWVKRLQIQPNGKLVLISDNSFYPPMTLDLKTESDVEIVGQVVNVSKDFF
ncbi:Phage repressor protein C, contains Cro/C1-type HTH and peptisase s24 domains [Moraxella cuniculi DSM 21768]|uniref:Phage repressor protein C, contains Cro/C1-type HTH and peptisase s24 domains n=1 Tax=Moraxella cuniculi DSM 21768 TaxID=1122245 RepID=A0A1N7DHM0_9GAMM|nr:S24 family peptidase [Moraxella cuniculi]OOS08064.1 hypothetical protein B0189_01650 [Moraxella cuniculi]SIR75245.1 Phage repressor protein C, contains Cro/C1-type HTH and peptisase s24 domains [Moraxella cuniculi DSM 21768]